MTPKNQLARRTLAALGALALTLGVNDAEASGFLNARFGADHGNPVGANPFSIYFNPAAITRAQGTQLVLDNSFVYRIASYDRPPSALSPSPSQNPDNDVYRRANTGKATIGNFLALPFIGVTTSDLAPNLTVGFASYVPFGGVASWGKNDNFSPGSPGGLQAPGAYDGQVRWHSISGSIIALYNTVAIAYRLPDYGLSFGVNASVIYHRIETIRARNLNGSDDVVTESGGLLEGRSLVEASGVNASLGLGVMWEPNDDLRLGLSYTTRPGFGQMELDGKLTVRTPGLSTEYDIALTQTYPDVIRFGVGYEVSEDVELRADLEYVRWSAFRRQCILNREPGYNAGCRLYDNGASTYDDGSGRLDIIQVVPRNWHDAGSLRVGVGYHLTEETELFGSVTGDTYAPPASTLDATFIDSFKLVGTLGARHFFTKSFALGGSYNHAYFFQRSTNSSALYSGYVRPSNSPSGNGTYNQQILFVDLNGTFYF
ncbi:MAG TPA: outer membrane protein transport protein [Polyangiaceae bacterium]|nr:outer membrane protein transport protein [Polyangiaceae bacterium]